MTPAPLTAEQIEALQIEAVVGAIALLFVERRRTPREPAPPADLTIEEVVDRR